MAERSEPTGGREPRVATDVSPAQAGPDRGTPARLDHRTRPANQDKGAGRARNDSDDAAATIRRQIDEHGARVLVLASTRAHGEPEYALIPAADAGRALSGAIAVSTAPDGAVRLLSPDPRTLRFIAADPTGVPTAHLTCDLRTPDGVPADECPRRSLKQALETLREAGLTARVSVECRLLPPVGRGRSGSQLRSLLPAVVSALSDCRLTGLTVRWRDSDEGAYLSIGPLAAMDAADGMQLVRGIVTGTLTRRPAAGAWPETVAIDRLAVGIHHGKRNVFADRDGGISDAAGLFLAGTRAHAPGLAALLRPGLAAGEWSAWPAPSSILTSPEPGWTWGTGWAGPLAIGIAHGALTISGAGMGANPYLILTGLICSGLGGLRRTVDTAADGTLPPCPLDPAAALRQLTADECLCEGLGRVMTEAYATAVTDHWRRSAGGRGRPVQ